MNRRDLLGSLLTLPALAVGARAVTAAAPIRLTPRAVSTDLEVFDLGEGLRFSMTLLDHPWPQVGQPIAFAHGGMELAGRVERVFASSHHGTGRFWYRIEGRVEHFEARPIVPGGGAR
jgi:hypothetical protein